MDTGQWIILGATGLTLLVTVIGWSVTYWKQVQLAKKQGVIQIAVQEHDTRFTYLHRVLQTPRKAVE